MFFKYFKIYNTIRTKNFISKSLYSSVTSENNSLKRAVLYVPGSDKKKIQKSLSLGADCTVIDCEDGVAVNRKLDARENIRELLKTNNINLTVRINSVQSNIALDDLKCIFDAQNKPMCIFIPKTDEFDQIKWLYENIDKLANENRFNFFFYMESSTGLLNLKDLVSNAIKLSETKYKSKYNIEGVVFGSDDYCADIGATRTKDAVELSFARQFMVTVCKAFKLQAVDMVFIDYKDQNGLKLQSEEGARIGFTGKQVIHPSQIEIVQKAFSPSEEKIKWAKNLIEAFKEHQNSGKGAFTYLGCMIDKPLLLQAQNILAILKK